MNNTFKLAGIDSLSAISRSWDDLIRFSPSFIRISVDQKTAFNRIIPYILHCVDQSIRSGPDNASIGLSTLRNVEHCARRMTKEVEFTPEEFYLMIACLRQAIGELGPNYSQTQIAHKDRVLDRIGIYVMAMLRTSDDKVLSLAIESRLVAENALAKAEASKQKKSDLLAEVSHELRSPLSVIAGFAQILLEERPNSFENLNYLRAIHNSSRQMLVILNDVLDLSKIEAGKVDLNLESFSPLDLLSDVLFLFSDKAQRQGLNVYTKVLSPIPEEITADTGKLRQILINILGNAFKFTSEGSVTVSVKFEPSSSKEGYGELSFEISDTGPGLSEEGIKRLFQAYMQSDPSISNKFGGTGLGLMLAKRLAISLDGDVKVLKSDLGKGTSFGISIWALASAKYETVQGQLAFGKRFDEESSGRAIRVLIVDDASDNRFLMSQIVLTFNASFETAIDGSEAIEKASAQKFDLILMDIQMPNMNGIDACRALRSLGYRGRIVALTGLSQIKLSEISDQSLFDDILQKPFDRIHLARIIDKIQISSSLSKPL